MKKPQPTIDSSIDFDLRQLEIFRNVVDLSSFSKAAEAVCLAQAFLYLGWRLKHEAFPARGAWA